MHLRVAIHHRGLPLEAQLGHGEPVHQDVLGRMESRRASARFIASAVARRMLRRSISRHEAAPTP
jgi:hypothetical protein